MDLLIGYIGITGLIFLLLIVNRQVLGAGLYTTFGPIIMASLLYSNILIGFSFLVLLLASYLARELTNLFIKRVYASQILKNILYLWLTILFFFAVHYPGYSLGSMSGNIFFDDNQILLTLGYIILFAPLMSKIYSYGKGELTKRRLGYIVRFFVLTIIILLVIQSSWLLSFFAGNITMLVFLTIAIIAVGLYDGLQIKEMFRFRKLIRINGLLINTEKNNVI